MNVPTAPESTTSSLRPIFTLGSALRWLGHDCPSGRCYSTPFDTMEASMWFLRRRRLSRTYPLESRIVVDLVGTGQALLLAREMIYELNWCTRRDGIEVRHRPLHDAHTAIARRTLAAVPEPG